jgi:hypothetical protein
MATNYHIYLTHCLQHSKDLSKVVRTITWTSLVSTVTTTIATAITTTAVTFNITSMAFITYWCSKLVSSSIHMAIESEAESKELNTYLFGLIGCACSVTYYERMAFN